MYFMSTIVRYTYMKIDVEYCIPLALKGGTGFNFCDVVTVET